MNLIEIITITRKLGSEKPDPIQGRMNYGLRKLKSQERRGGRPKGKEAGYPLEKVWKREEQPVRGKTGRKIDEGRKIQRWKGRK